jgi:hypothetical protein
MLALTMFVMQLSAQSVQTNATKSIVVNKVDLLQMPIKPIQSVLPNQYMQSLGFFCKQEIQLQKRSIMPVKFRVGTQQSCDHIEGK